MGKRNDEKLEGTVKDLDNLDCRIFLRSNQTGSWTTVWGTMVTGTVLSTMEFCYFFAHTRTKIFHFLPDLGFTPLYR